MNKEKTMLSHNDAYILKLIKTIDHYPDQNINKHIAQSLLNKVKNKKKLYKATTFCEEIAISPASLSMFSKKLNFTNVKELIFIHNNSLNLDKIIDKEKNQQLVKAANLINKANKILFIGVSSSIASNLDFHIKLVRMNKNSILLWNKYEQVGISRILTSKDVIVINSISLSHKWMIDVIKNTEAKIILISSWIPKEIENKVSFFFQIKGKERHDGLRLFTLEGRLLITEIYYKIFKILTEDSTNYKYLEKSAYR
ncbi:hypothetical protein GE118_01785 [Mycoplasma sp. NEAQ87857]|uniref:hypothetical protein n=1 Tax=Mycoplasma sp. NEAQ87857 TaxID=2683967 RepID=UPI001319A0C9|nr:hypothetical protein [Mycoplasma sp. NEAQ87857]QGZ97526.1 hypothetical protein GE118_01785 [Mycoplasma sp. NEAQ87857]